MGSLKKGGEREGGYRNGGGADMSHKEAIEEGET